MQPLQQLYSCDSYPQLPTAAAAASSCLQQLQLQSPQLPTAAAAACSYLPSKTIYACHQLPAPQLPPPPADSSSLTAPHMRNALQAMKKGIMEVADVIVVNKADGPMEAAAGVRHSAKLAFPASESVPVNPPFHPSF